MTAPGRLQSLPEAGVVLTEHRNPITLELVEPTPWRKSLTIVRHKRIIRERDSLLASFNNAVTWRTRNRGRCPDDWRWAASLAFQHDWQIAEQIDFELNRSEYVVGEIETAPAQPAMRRAA